MNSRRVFSFCFLSASLIASLSEAWSGYTAMEGEDFCTDFSFNVPAGSRKYLCRNDCKDQDILVQTEGKRVRSGRYTIRYDDKDGKVHVVIEGLTKADAGQYKVGVSTSTSQDAFEEFYIQVRDVCDGGVDSSEPRVYHATEGGNVTITCSVPLNNQSRKFLCRDECHKLFLDTRDVFANSGRHTVEYKSQGLFQVTITRLTRSDSGKYRCGVEKQSGVNTCQEFEIAFPSTGSILPLVVGVPVAAVLLTVLVLLACRWKMRRKVEYVNTRASGRDMEIYDDCAAASKPPSSLYQDLDPSSREDGQYWSLRVSP